MRNGGRLSAAIEVLSDFERRRVPLKIALADWARGARFAGAKDRAWVSGLCLDVLRRRRSLAAAMNDDSPRAAAFGGLRWLWGYSTDDLEALAAEAPHGPGKLTDIELTMLGKATPDLRLPFRSIAPVSKAISPIGWRLTSRAPSATRPSRSCWPLPSAPMSICASTP